MFVKENLDKRKYIIENMVDTDIVFKRRCPYSTSSLTNYCNHPDSFNIMYDVYENSIVFFVETEHNFR